MCKKEPSSRDGRNINERPSRHTVSIYDLHINDIARINHTEILIDYSFFLEVYIYCSVRAVRNRSKDIHFNDKVQLAVNRKCNVRVALAKRVRIPKL